MQAAEEGAPAGIAEAQFVSTAEVSALRADALRVLGDRLGAGPFALVILFLSPSADLASIAAGVGPVFGGTPVIGCTTAGEIAGNGYAENRIVAVGLPSAHFGTHTVFIEDLEHLDPQEIIGRLVRARQSLGHRLPNWENEFAFLMVDGLSVREDELTSALASGLGPVPLIGGSAGDGTRFRSTFLLHEGKLHQNAAVLSFVRSDCAFKVFNLDHFTPTEQRMVVTEADPRRRTVRTINAEPAAREYARLLGKDPNQLTTFTFATHPVVVRIGGRHHVRAIQQVAENGDLVFFAAIDEGLVLTLAEAKDMVNHLRHELDELARPAEPVAILACDCLFRRLEAEQKQMVGQVSDLLRRHHVVGFSTYGEQAGALHVNQTMTGIAFYPPGTAL